MPEIGKDGLHSKKGGEATTPRKSSKGAGPGSTKSENEDKTTKVIEVKKTRSRGPQKFCFFNPLTILNAFLLKLFVAKPYRKSKSIPKQQRNDRQSYSLRCVSESDTLFRDKLSF